jgi:hypothetical protein
VKNGPRQQPASVGSSGAEPARGPDRRSGRRPESTPPQNAQLKVLFSIGHAVLAALFAALSVLLTVVAVYSIWTVIAAGLGDDSTVPLIEAIGNLAVAVVSLQIAQTIVEEEVIRSAHVSAPTRVRRFLSRFIVVVVIALAIEALVATMKALLENVHELPYAASVILAVGALIAGWGIFIRLNRSAEELEPEAMAQAKEEDSKVD